jgi:hypothetical protein
LIGSPPAPARERQSSVVPDPSSDPEFLQIPPADALRSIRRVPPRRLSNRGTISGNASRASVCEQIQRRERELGGKHNMRSRKQKARLSPGFLFVYE